jgi:hypothetical protein
MKITTTIFGIILFATSVSAQQHEITESQFDLQGQIINPVSLPPHCGTFAFAMAVEFEIINFSDTSYTHDSIAVVFTCPESYGENFFVVGKTYNLKVADQNQANFSYSIINEGLLNKYDSERTLWVRMVEEND